MAKKNHGIAVGAGESSVAGRGTFVAFTLTGQGIKRGALCFVGLAFALLMPGILCSVPGFDKVLNFGVALATPFSEMPEGGRSFENIILYTAVNPVFKGACPEQGPPPAKPEEPEITKPKITEAVPNGGIDIKNETDYNIDVAAILGERLDVVNKSSTVLIVHTHGSESYTPSENYYYEPQQNYRTADTAFSVIRVGEELAGVLRARGIEVIHDKNVNDYPSYNDSYNKTEKIIKEHLSKNDKISYVFDIHRDAVGNGEEIVKFVSEVNGDKAAGVMIVCGTDTNLENPDWQENLHLALHIQSHLQNKYPGFMRPLNLRRERFNMHLTTGSILFEIGTNGNTLEEALTAARYLGDGIADIINNQ